MDDSLTIRFLLPEGHTATGKRSEWTVVTFVSRPSFVDDELAPSAT